MNAPHLAATTRLVTPDARSLEEAADLLRSGRLVAFPTETVYGLGADATQDEAVARIFAAKERPRFNPLILHLADALEAEALVFMNDQAWALADRFWPGPLTLVLPRRPAAKASLLASAGLDSLALRVPALPVARRLLAAAGRPVAAPSANLSGRVSPTTPQHVLEELGGRIPLILAGGRAPVGLESTVVDLTGGRPRLLRPGAITRDDLLATVGMLDDPAGTEPPRAPGQLSSHYAPSLPVRLNAAALRPGEALLTFGPDLRRGEAVRNLSEKGDLQEAAANLFSMLRELDRSDISRGIAVVPIPETGLGEAINDRLRRAAA